MTSCVDVREGPCSVDEGAWHVDGCHYDDAAEAFSIGLLGFCGCGIPEDIAAMFRDYLTLIKKRHDNNLSNTDWHVQLGVRTQWTDDSDAIDALFPNERMRYLVAYEADRAELTEHGGNVSGAWLTEKGEQWLTLLDRVFNLEVHQ